MGTAYWAGFLTVPAILLGLYLLAHGVRGVLRFLWARGFSVEFKADRRPERVSNYVRRNHIWWEQQRGPIYTGHWYREDGRGAFLTRWIGLGSAEGRSIMFFRKRELV